ncbi:MAG: efflux RND transporter periplasmic adaptor subunit [Proteocatella sp.]
MVSWKKIIIAAIIAIALGIAVYTNTRPLEVSYTMPKIKTYEDIVLASGEIVSDESLKLNSQASGEVLVMDIEEGDKINKNQVIAKLDSKELQKNIDEKSAEVTLSESSYDATISTSYELAKKDIERLKLELIDLNKSYEKTKLLFESGVASKQEVEDLENAIAKKNIELESAEIKMQSYSENGSEAKRQQSQLQKAQVGLKNAQQDASKYIIKSPVAGIVTKKYISQGEVVQTGAQIVEISRTDKRYAQIKIDEKYVGDIKVNQIVNVYPSSSPDKKISSKISYISPFVDKDTGTITAKIEIPKSSEDTFLLSLTVTVEIITKSYNNALVLPFEYVVFEDNNSYIFIAENGKAKKLPVNIIGNRKEVKIEEVDEYISQDTKILAPKDLKDGSKIKLKESKGE